ncbi:conjugative coupling factor TraD, PFGI-1 class [Serratia plymuthica]|nr:conjugative coupling factor TraD, PFGI-1 class [Serratia plymuthica]
MKPVHAFIALTASTWLHPATAQLSKVEVHTTSLMSGTTDSSDPRGNTAFTSNTSDRINSTSVPLIEPAHVVALPKGQAFALIEGGNLWKVRMPLPAPDPDETPLLRDRKRLPSS